jgi:hypothetical protein
MEFNMKSGVLISAFALLLLGSGVASADSVWYCSKGDCVGRNVPDSGPRYGSYRNPIEDDVGGDLSGPVHRGMYCVRGEWHHGWLRSWEASPVIKSSCGAAVRELPY